MSSTFHVVNEKGYEINITKLHFGPTKSECYAKTGDGNWYRVLWANELPESQIKSFSPDTIILMN